jgi:APA family basic amino acid/polyamine antiporter
MVYLGTVFGLRLSCLTGKYGDLLDFVVIIVLIFYIPTILGIFILRRKMPDAERPYRAWISVFTGAIVASAICIAYCTPKQVMSG